MTNTAAQPTFTEVAEMLLRSAELAYTAAIDEATAKLATGDFAYYVGWSAEDNVRLQFRVRFLTKAVQHGIDAAVELLPGPISDTSRPGSLYDRAVAESERVEALSLLRSLRGHMRPERVVALVDRMY